nr:reverse transcriptase domain-containing protein [Tanacetum cinerariifolium]
MSAMANTTPLMTTVTKPATNPRDADATPMVNIQDFCKEYYEDILPIIMEKVCRDRRKDVHTRLDFGEGPREKAREDSHHSRARARTTKLKRDHPRGRSHPHRLDTSKEDRPKDRERFRSVGESYDDFFSHSYRDGNRSRHMKRRRDNESPLSSVLRSDSSDRSQGWFDELPPESIDSYKDLKAAFLAYFMQQKKYVKDPVEIHNIKQKDGETIEDFMERFKVETGRMKGDPEYEAGKFQPSPPMVTPIEKRSSNKFCDFYNDKGHSTDECMQLKKLIEELVRAGKLSHLIKEIKHGRDQLKIKKKETTTKDKPTTIYMIQSWQRTTRQKVTQSFKRVKEITFPPLAAGSGTEGPLIIEAEMGGHMIHRMYVDGGSLMKILYEHCFNRLRPEIKSQMVPTTTSLMGFSGETIWPLGELRLLVIIGDANHSIRAWMNFMIVSTVLIPTECTSLITSSAVSKEERTRPDNFKVALHPNFPDQEVAIRGTCWELNVRSIPTSSAVFPLPVMCSHCQKKFPLVVQNSSHC